MRPRERTLKNMSTRPLSDSLNCRKASKNGDYFSIFWGQKYHKGYELGFLDSFSYWTQLRALCTLTCRGQSGDAHVKGSYTKYIFTAVLSSLNRDKPPNRSIRSNGQLAQSWEVLMDF